MQLFISSTTIYLKLKSNVVPFLLLFFFGHSKIKSDHRICFYMWKRTTIAAAEKKLFLNICFPFLWKSISSCICGTRFKENKAKHEMLKIEILKLIERFSAFLFVVKKYAHLLKTFPICLKYFLLVLCSRWANIAFKCLFVDEICFLKINIFAALEMSLSFSFICFNKLLILNDTEAKIKINQSSD